jgi:nicotinate phosphoribosyltransferase
MSQIIKSLLDTDLYKFSMLCAYFENFANATAKYDFADRLGQLPCTKEFAEQINIQLDYLCNLRLTDTELDFLFRLDYFHSKRGFREFLKNFKLDRRLIHCKLGQDGKIKIHTDEDSILATTMFEIPVLSIVNELYGRYLIETDQLSLMHDSYSTTVDFFRTKTLNDYETIKMPFMEFGTRRRFNQGYQQSVVEGLKNLSNFIGTSNVKLAQLYGIKPLGTQAHEFYMLGQALDDVPVAQSQIYMSKVWMDTFGGDLAIFLTDTLGTDKFLRDFSLRDAKQYDGVRHDSGCPYVWTNEMIKMYEGYGINPIHKRVIYSDGVNLELANKLHEEFSSRIQQVAGIGTALSNPMCPTNFVMKPTTMNGKPVAKLSNNPGKIQCLDAGYVKYLLSTSMQG